MEYGLNEHNHRRYQSEHNRYIPEEVEQVRYEDARTRALTKSAKGLMDHLDGVTTLQGLAMGGVENSYSSGLKSAAISDKAFKFMTLNVDGIVAQRMYVGSGNGVVVIGRSMKERVIKYAEGTGIDYFKASDKAFNLYAVGDEAMLLQENVDWVKNIKRKDFSVIDIGYDPNFTKQGDFSLGGPYWMENKYFFGDY